MSSSRLQLTLVWPVKDGSRKKDLYCPVQAGPVAHQPCEAVYLGLKYSEQNAIRQYTAGHTDNADYAGFATIVSESDMPHYANVPPNPQIMLKLMQA